MNAVQASPAGGRVTIRETTDPPWIQIDVLDEGGGVPDAERERLFSPFFTTKQGGTGLGLAIAQRIVAAHEGRIKMMPGLRGWVRVQLPIAGARPSRSNDEPSGTRS